MDDEEQIIVLDSSRWTGDMRIHSYNSELNSWVVKKPPSIWNDRRDFGVILISSTLIFAGGCIHNDEATNEVLWLNLETMKFSENPPMLEARADFALVELKEELYAVGGLVNEEWSTSVEKYDFSKCKWHAVAPLRSVMKFVSVAVLDGFLYAIGQYSSSMQCYDPVSNQWSPKAVPNSKLQQISIIGFGDFLYALCRGYNNETLSITLERYDPSKNIWETKQSPRYGEKCVVLRNRLLTCGLKDSYKKEYTVEEYNQETNEWSILTQMSATQKVHSVFTLKK